MSKTRFLGLAAVPLALLAIPAQAQTTPEAPAAAPTPPPMAAQAPVPLFKAVCIDGSARLSPKWAKATTYATLPSGARTAVGQPAANVPNAVFQIAGANEFLIVPAPDAKTPFAMGCAVVWRGDGLAEANKLLSEAPADLIVTATTGNGWTVLKAFPRTPPAPVAAGQR